MQRFTSLFAAGLLLAVGVSTVRADKIELTGTLRDFKMSTQAGGHPDFENTGNGQYPLVTGMVQSGLGADMKPVLNNSPLTTTVSLSSSTKITSVTLKFADNTTQAFTSLSTTSGTWPSSPSTKSIKSVAVVLKGSSTSYTLTDGSTHTATTNGITATFAVSENIPTGWRVSSVASFKQWYTNVTGVNQSIPYTIVLDNGATNPGGTYTFEASKHNGVSFFPLDGQCFGNQGQSHNYSFTYEIATKFTYTARSTRNADMVFNFSGDDDVWVYINHKLVVDLGGVHPEQYASVNVDSLASQLGLVAGQTYDFNIFYAERHTTESNCTIQTTIQFLSPLYD